MSQQWHEWAEKVECFVCSCAASGSRHGLWVPQDHSATPKTKGKGIEESWGGWHCWGVLWRARSWTQLSLWVPSSSRYYVIFSSSILRRNGKGKGHVFALLEIQHFGHQMGFEGQAVQWVFFLEEDNLGISWPHFRISATNWSLPSHGNPVGAQVLPRLKCEKENKYFIKSKNFITHLRNIFNMLWRISFSRIDLTLNKQTAWSMAGVEQDEL